ncbi:MAG: DeoR/GlpR family DNA-binding transcription regulator [Ruminiclostridium sp.]
MFAAQRIKVIKEIMIKNKSVDIATLTNILNVSDVTVRKDLDTLEKENFLVKNHGGAVIVDSDEKVLTKDFTIENYLEKEQIANLAYTLVEDGDTIFLGHGSTCYIFAKSLKEKKNITVVTTNVNALNELLPNVSKTILIGGEVSYNNGMMFSTGELTVENLKGIFVNKCFMSVDAVDLMTGFTVNDVSNLSVLKLMPKLSKQLIFLADHSKFDKIGFYQIAPINLPNCIISNDRLNDKYKQFFYEKNIKVLTAFDL